MKVLVRTLVDDIPIRRFFKREVGDDGKDISFWLDPWISNETLKERYPVSFQLDRDKRCKVYDQVKYIEGQTIINWQWNRNIIEAEEVEALVWLHCDIIQVRFWDGPNKWTWTVADADGFSVSSVKSLIAKGEDHSNNYVLEWSKWVPVKCNVFAWRAEMGRILTAMALRGRNIFVEDSSCPLCGCGNEMVDHIFTN